MWISGIPHVPGRNAYTDVDGRKYGIAVHATANTASDEAEASYAQHRPDGISSHFYADRDSVIQSLDTNARAGHAGSRTGNENAIAVEITGLGSWSRETWIANVQWAILGRVLAEVCRAYDIAPRRASVAEMVSNPKVRAFYGHNDMRLAWGGTTHTDPGINFPWDVLLKAVQDNLTPPAPRPPADEEDSMPEIIGPVAVPVDSFVNIPLPPVEDGAWPRKAFLNICNDTFDTAYALRVAIGNGRGGWAVQAFTLGSNAHWSTPLPKGCTVVEISRQAIDASGQAVAPTPDNLAYAGPLAVSIERGPLA
jgi:hypothetical protein